MNIPIILGTARAGRQSAKVADFIYTEVKKNNFKTEIIDVKDYRLSATDRSEKTIQAKKFAQKLKESDALIIVSPEYNHSYPGELKMFLDLLYTQYYQLPVGICSVSSGIFGGVRMTEKLIPLLINFGMLAIKETLIFPNIEKNKLENYSPKIERFLNELQTLVKKT